MAAFRPTYQNSILCHYLNPLIVTLKPQSNGSSYSNIVIGELLAVDGWAVTFGTARGLGRSPPRPLLGVPNVTAHPSTAGVPT